jgi:hypothetical protein
MIVTYKAFDYTWDQILQRVGYLNNPPFNIQYGDLKKEGSNGIPKVKIYRSTDDQWHELIKLKVGELCWSDKKDFLPNNHDLQISNRIPILFPEKKDLTPPLIEYDKDDNSIEIKFDLIAACFFMLSRWEETVVPERDQHNRFSAGSSVAYRQGFLNQPIVDEYALIIRTWLNYLIPDLNLTIYQPSLQLTHDIDFINRFINPWKVFEYGFKEIKTFSLLKGIKNTRVKYSFEKKHPESTDYVNSIKNLALISKELSLNSIFFFQAANQSPFDSGYDIRKQFMTQLFSFLKENGQKIGLHSSYFSNDDYSRMKKEYELLGDATNQFISRCRQHYLRIDVPRFWQIEEKIGITDDYSLGYASQEGFRAGTCHPFQVYDVDNQRKIELVEHPLILMDTTINNYKKLSTVDARALIFQLALKCHNVGGDFSILWHNTSLSDKWQNWGILYKEIITEIRNLF